MPLTLGVVLLLHLVGLALGMGAATAKTVLLVRTRSDHQSVATYMAVTRPITVLIILGLVLLTASGVPLILMGHAMTPLLVWKIVLVVVLWALGPLIDKALEPRFAALAPRPGEAASPEFPAARQRLVGVEVLATGLFYAITAVGVFL